MDITAEVHQKAKTAKTASRLLATMDTAAKNAALAAVSDALDQSREMLLMANAKDLAVAQDKGVPPHMVDRLALNDKRIDSMRTGLAQVIGLPDPVGTVTGGMRRPNGLQITQLRVPLGVIGIIYESRPNVTVDAAALCLKAGNSVVLRGGSEAIHSNTALARVIADAVEGAGLPPGSVSLIENTDRAGVHALITANEFVDCIIPRGGASLIEMVVKNSTVPVIETGTGNCHIYVDSSADATMAEQIIINAKCQRPSVCNAMETLLVQEEHLPLPLMYWLQRLQEKGVEIRGCSRTVEAVAEYNKMGWAVHPIVLAAESDYHTEFNDLILAVKIVGGVQEAITHINQYGTRHSEAIITSSYPASRDFCDGVDAAAVYVNASTRFTDGFEFGFGAEIGISNQKLHARGPMGLEELTTTKYVVLGNGQIRE